MTDTPSLAEVWGPRLGPDKNSRVWLRNMEAVQENPERPPYGKDLGGFSFNPVNNPDV